MNRLEEYEEMMRQLEIVPPSQCIQKAIRRRNRKKAAVRTFGSVAAVFCIFVAVINLSPTAAAVCREIPFLNELTDLLIFRPSIQMAVDNDYLQIIDQEQSDKDITARVEYLVVDQKQVNIYYRLKSNVYEALSATPEVRDAEGNRISAAISTGGLYDDNEELRELTIDFMEENVPSSLTLTLRIYDNGSFDETEPVAEVWDQLDMEEPETITELTFPLNFDPYFTAQGESVELNQVVEIDGQKLTVTGVEIYPSHIRINVEEDPENTAWIKSLRFYLELEDGRRVEKIANGISATGNESSPYATSYRAESNYFAHADFIRMQITGADFLDKEREHVQVNLKTLEHDPLPEGAEIKCAQQYKDGWEITFRIRKTEESHAQLLGSFYQDADGETYEINHYSSTFESYDEETGKCIEGWEEETYYLDGLKKEEVVFSVNYNRFWNPETPIEVELQ